MAEDSSELPRDVRDYLSGLLRASWRPGFLQVGADGVVIAAGGDLEPYGLSAAAVGTIAVEQVPLLSGLLPLAPQSEPFIMPWVNLDASGYMDLHIVSGTGFDYVICTEAAVSQSDRVLMQQNGNELALQQHRQSQLLDRHVGQYIAGQLLSGQVTLRPEGERREASLLFCDLRGFTTYAENHQPEQVFATLNRFLQAMVQPILDGGGWLDKIAGDAVYSAFGLIPLLESSAPVSAAQQAVHAALQIMSNVRALNDERRTGGLEPLWAGIGITTGSVAVGVLGTHERRQFAVIGHHVNLAARLQAQALAGEIIVDQRTHAELQELGHGFVPRTLRLKGLREELIAQVLTT